MSNRIPVPTLASAPEASKPILEKLQAGLGKLPNLYATIGHSAAALSGFLTFQQALGQSTLSAREVESINLHVSELNGCGYCLAAHSPLAKRAGLSPEEIASARAGQASGLRESAVLALARRVTRTGGAGAGGDLAAAREAGLSDAEVIEVIALTTARAFANAVALVAQTEVDFPKVPRAPAA